MTEQELRKALAEESNSVEWKAGGDPEKIVKTLTAYANDYEGSGSGKAHLDWLAQPCPNAKLEDIDYFALAEITKKLPSPGSSEYLQPDFRIFGSVPALTSRVETPAGSAVVPNRFAILLAGKSPHHFMPGAFAVLTRFPGVTRADDVFSSREVFGPIPYLIREVMGALESEVSVITDKNEDFLSGNQNRWRYSSAALQEILVNALVHRDYRIGLSTKIYVFQDRIEFENSGGLLRNVTIEALKQGWPQWRNLSLARFLFDLGLAQERGTGIPKAVKLTRAVADAEPIIEADDGWFKVTVPAYRPRFSRQTEDHPVSPEAGVLLISIGHGTINMAVVRRSRVEFRNIADERIRSYHHPGFVEAERWPELIQELRNWLRDSIEDPRFQEFHLFYRGPVSVGPLIGAMATNRKPLIVYSYDEDLGLYQFAYRLDRRLLQES